MIDCPPPVGGTDATGQIPLYAQDDLVYLNFAGAGNVIGTNGDGNGDAAERNVIAGSLLLSGSGTTNTVVAGNLIGVAADGHTVLNGGFNSLVVFGGASFNRIGVDGDGLTSSAERNVLRSIVIADAGTTANAVAGNDIGLAPDGVTPNDPRRRRFGRQRSAELSGHRKRRIVRRHRRRRPQ